MTPFIAKLVWLAGIIGWYVIRGLETVGLATNVRR